ncbi:MAG: type II secretion system protein [Candidatus Harrisonbacteria bacterium]|nr:type II secretion system protein [Candidatus Harrisonbacteria bacterium]MBI2406175.1 type II secretion system protein [Candidatus Harrisonbacteria bacterium]MBI2604306.1 type II secretion system protein [Candidatus Harrisonbacteria bacterium]
MLNVKCRLPAVNCQLSNVNCATQGFTLIEIVLVVAIFGVLIASATTAITQFQARSDLDLAVTSGVGILRLAEERARGVDGDAVWGVKFATGTFTLFLGASYAARNIAFDEDTAVGDAIAASGTTEFVFTRLLATTTTAGTTTLMSSISGESRDIGVNAKGTITY